MMTIRHKLIRKSHWQQYPKTSLSPKLSDIFSFMVKEHIFFLHNRQKFEKSYYTGKIPWNGVDKCILFLMKLIVFGKSSCFHS